MSCQIYLISPPEFKLDKFAVNLDNVLSTKLVPVFQLRMKNVEEAKIINAAKILIPICHKNDCQFILNDSPELAIKVGADGVHIGEPQDGTVKKARDVVGDKKVVGYSCYASYDRAMQGADDGADYVAFGQFYETATKPAKGNATLDLLKNWSELTEIPCVAIGGINAGNCKPIVEAGADFIAVVSAVWAANDPVKSVEELYKSINN